MDNKLKRLERWLILLMVLPIISYLIIVFNYSVNAPFWDDYDAVIGHLIQFKSSNPFTGKFRLLVDQHNEHRIIFDRLIFHLQSFITGEVNFYYLIAFGNILLICLFILLIKIFQSNPSFKLIYLLPVPFILFQLQFHEASLWATTSIQNFGIILFSLLALYFLDRIEKSRSNLFYALLFSVLAILTNTNGLLLVIIGAILLIEKDRQWKNLTIWLIVLLPIFGAYFINYRSNPDHPGMLSSLKDPLAILEYLCYYLGGYFRFATSYLGNKITLLFGLALLVAFIYLVFSRKYTSNRPLSYLLLFLFTTAGITALARSGFGVYQALSPRYMINPTVITVVLYYFLIIHAKNEVKRYATLLVVFSLSIYLNIYSFNRVSNYLQERKERLMLTQLEPAYPLISHGLEKIEKAEKVGLYKIPSQYLKNLASHPLACKNKLTSGDIYYQLRTIYLDEYLVFYESLAFDEQNYSSQSEVKVILSEEGTGKTYCFKANKRYLEQVNINDRDVKSAGFNLIIQKKQLIDGTFKIGLQTIDPSGQSAYLNTDKKLFNYNSEYLSPAESRFRINKQVNDSIVSLNGWAMKVKSSSSDFEILISLINNLGAEQVYSTQSVKRPRLTKKFIEDSTNYNYSAFKLKIPKSSLIYDKYDMQILLLDKDKKQFLRIKTNKKLVLRKKKGEPK